MEDGFEYFRKIRIPELGVYWEGCRPDDVGAMKRKRRKPSPPKRPETGPMQFDGEQADIFICGDQALYFAQCITEALKGNSSPEVREALDGLADMLRGCDARAGSWSRRRLVLLIFC